MTCVWQCAYISVLQLLKGISVFFFFYRMFLNRDVVHFSHLTYTSIKMWDFLSDMTFAIGKLMPTKTNVRQSLLCIFPSLIEEQILKIITMPYFFSPTWLSSSWGIMLFLFYFVQKHPLLEKAFLITFTLLHYTIKCSDPFLFGLTLLPVQYRHTKI